MTSIAYSPPTAGEVSAAVAAAKEAAAAVHRLTTLAVPAGERAAVIGHLGEVAQHLFDTAFALSIQVHEEAPSGGTLGTPDGWLPPAGRAERDLDEASRFLAWARDAFNDAVTAVEDMAQEASSEQADDTLNGGHP